MKTFLQFGKGNGQVPVMTAWGFSAIAEYKEKKGTNSK